MGTASPRRRPIRSGDQVCFDRAGKPITPPGTYIVARGDTLWEIAEVHYDKGTRYTRIFRANRTRISDPDLIYPCQRLYLPARGR